jgi:hypothetical protein
MSQAFVRETDDQWLNEVGPSLRALTTFLTRENGGVRVYEQRNYFDGNRNEIFVMSNGLSYSKNDKSEWYVVNDQIGSDQTTKSK